MKRIFWKYFKYIMVSPLCFIILILVRIVSPLFKIRFGTLMYDRIGHFALNTELYLCEKDSEINQYSNRTIEIFAFYNRAVCNEHLANMWLRVLNIWPLVMVNCICIMNRNIPFGTSYIIPDGIATNSDRDIHNLLEKIPPHLHFSESEKSLGEVQLEKLGIPKGSRYVCIIVRDSKYLEKNDSGIDYSYHNYRDCNVENFILAAEELAERGYYVLRMGKNQEKQFISKHPRVIDYANSNLRNDFMDIYLGAYCKFAVSTGAGWSGVPHIFRRPVAYANHVPINHFNLTVGTDLIITKHCFSKQDGKELTLKEIVKLGVNDFSRSEFYKEKGIELYENSDEEIRDLCTEMDDRLEGMWNSSTEDEELQKKFREIYPKDATKLNGLPYHGEIRARYGAKFLRKNPWWLE